MYIRIHTHVPCTHFGYMLNSGVTDTSLLEKNKKKKTKMYRSRHNNRNDSKHKGKKK